MTGCTMPAKKGAGASSGCSRKEGDGMKLAEQTCRPCEGGTPPMSESQIREKLKELKGWAYENGEITKTFMFKNYYETTAFVQAVVWISHRQDHHPEIEFGYKKCRVRYATHAIKGISENDFICAAKADALLES